MYFSNIKDSTFKKRSGFDIARNYSDLLINVFGSDLPQSKKTKLNRNMLVAGFMAHNSSYSTH